MNILIYTKWFFPIPGGVQTVVRDLADGLSRWPCSDGNSGRVRVSVVTRTKLEDGQKQLYPFQLIRSPSLFEFVRLVRKADVVHLAGPSFLPLILGLVLRRPMVLEHHGFQVACPNGLLFFEPTQSQCPGHFMAGRYEKCFQCNRTAVGAIRSVVLLVATPIRRWLSSRARINVTPTEWLQGVIKLKRMVSVPHGVREQKLGKAISSNTAFAFQGRLVTSKGIQVLLSAAKRLHSEGRQFRIKIIGDGPELAVLQSQAADLGGQIEFWGHVPEEGLDNALCDVGTIIMPSIAGEVFGLVAAENMARGKLMIVSNVGALKEVVGQTGMIFEVGNADQLASCMREVLTNPERARSLREAGRIRAEEMFGRARMVERHMTLYQGLASQILR
jgi:glycosyltransferase involved in cell wall biosynthesis